MIDRYPQIYCNLFYSNHVIRTRIMNIITRPHRKGKFEKPVRMSFWLSKVKHLLSLTSHTKL